MRQPWTNWNLLRRCDDDFTASVRLLLRRNPSPHRQCRARKVDLDNVLEKMSTQELALPASWRELRVSMEVSEPYWDATSDAIVAWTQSNRPLTPAESQSLKSQMDEQIWRLIIRRSGDWFAKGDQSPKNKYGWWGWVSRSILRKKKGENANPKPAALVERTADRLFNPSPLRSHLAGKDLSQLSDTELGKLARKAFRRATNPNKSKHEHQQGHADLLVVLNEFQQRVLCGQEGCDKSITKLGKTIRGLLDDGLVARFPLITTNIVAQVTGVLFDEDKKNHIRRAAIHALGEIAPGLEAVQGQSAAGASALSQQLYHEILNAIRSCQNMTTRKWVSNWCAEELEKLS